MDGTDDFFTGGPVDGGGVDVPTPEGAPEVGSAHAFLCFRVPTNFPLVYVGERNDYGSVFSWRALASTSRLLFAS